MPSNLFIDSLMLFNKVIEHFNISFFFFFYLIGAHLENNEYTCKNLEQAYHTVLHRYFSYIYIDVAVS